ncbi:MAG TPA: von Willebrand factor type A domain-containing protein [Rariglobus sp.]|nr:von Willebrand factor type A domain-containing protein [Rariglobus sp.]
MNNDENFTRNSGDLSPELEARVVAWVLGEASAFEAAQLDVLCAEQPELAVFKRRLEAVHGLLGEAGKPLKPPLLLSPERRAKVLAVIGGDAPTIESVVAAPVKARRKPRVWGIRGLEIAACFAIIAFLSAIIIPTVGSVKKKAFSAVDAFERTQSEQLRVMEQEANVQQVVNSNVSANYPSENKASSLGNREMRVDGYAVGALSASATEAPARVFFDKAMAGSGLATTDAITLAMPEPPSSPVAASKPVAVVIAGNVTEFGVRGGAESEAGESQKQLRDQGQMLGLDVGAKRGDLAFGNQSNARLESLAAEGRYRRQIRPSSAADPFAAPGTEVSGEYASTRSLSEEKQNKLSVNGIDQFAGGAMVAANQPFEAINDRSSLDKDSIPFLGELKKSKSLEDASTQMKNRAGKLEEVTNVLKESNTYTGSTLVTSGSLQVGNGTPLSAPASSVLSVKMRQIVIPEVNFKEVPLSQVLSSLSAVSEEYDRSNENSAGANIVLLDPSAKDPLVSMTLRNLPLSRILDLVTDSTGYRYELQGDTVVVRPGDDGPLTRKPEVPLFDEALRTEIPTATESVSTFSLHVSDASFRLAKAALERGQAPDPATIRPEEFYNAFDYGDPSPAAGEAVSCRVEQAAHPFLQQRNLVRIAMKVPAAGRGSGQPLRLTVMLDTSGSMEREDRAATVRAALTALTSLLGPDDRVTLVGFARTPTLLAEGVPGDQATKIIELAARTPAEGGTNLEEALALAGKLAMRQKLATAQNRIVLLTDGAANLGDADPQALAKRVEALRQNGIAFDACGVVADGLDDSVLEALTRKGDGRYAVINSPEEADANFARQLAGAFRPAAKDVKVQVHFNPARVARYRLIGFEKHRLKTEDFRNDKVDAAELAAEEAAVAVYQVEVLPEGEGELGEVAVRFLDTRSNERVERSWTLAYSAQPAAFARATPSLQLAGSAAFVAEKLRGGALAGQVRLDEFAPVVEGLGAAYPNAPRVREFIQMFRQTRRLTGE